MDQKKIGLFIATCRKKKGLTQKQLAEKLSVTDKSVSKWERGIHLPDASLYIPLCEILGITINEFFLGEYETEHHEVVPQVLKEDYHKMQRNERWNIALFIMSMLKFAYTATSYLDNFYLAYGFRMVNVGRRFGSICEYVLFVIWVLVGLLSCV